MNKKLLQRAVGLLQRMLFVTAFWGLHVASSAITLEEYGVTLNGTGLVDHVSQLQWLDSSLTYGTTAALTDYIDAGWRLATEEEFLFLLGRGSNTSDLDGVAFLSMAQRLGFTADPDGLDLVQPWLCHAPGADPGICNQLDHYNYVSFALDVFPRGSTTHFNYYNYLATYQLYNLDQTQPCPQCMGSALLVRPVPLPAAVWLMLGALGALARVGQVDPKCPFGLRLGQT